MGMKSEIKNKFRQICIIFIGAFVYGVCNVWGHDIMVYDRIAYSNNKVILRILFWASIFFIMIIVLEYYINTFRKKCRNYVEWKETSKTVLLSKYTIII